MNAKNWLKYVTEKCILYMSGVVCLPALFYAANLQLYGKRSPKTGHKIMAQLRTLLHKSNG